MPDEGPTGREFQQLTEEIRELRKQFTEHQGVVNAQGRILSAVNARTEALQGAYERDLTDMRNRVMDVDRIARNRSLAGGAVSGGGLFVALQLAWAWLKTKMGA